MGSTTAAGSAIAISAGAPGTQDSSGYSALAFIEIGGVEKIGGIGASFAKTEFQPLKGPKQKYKGSADYGSLQPSVLIDESDAGQVLLQVAADDETNKLFAFKVTKPNGAVRYFQARVFGNPETIDGADALIMGTPSIEVCTKVVRVAAASSGVVAPTLTLTGSLKFAVGAAAGTVVATIGNVPAGVSPTLTPNDGRLAIAGDAANGWKVVVGLSAASAGTIALTVAAAGANSASASVTVSAATARAAIALGDIAVTVGCSTENDANWYGYIDAWMRALGYPLNYQTTRFGFPGSTPLQFYAQLQLALAARGAVIIIGDGVNSAIAGSAPAFNLVSSAYEDYIQQAAAVPETKEIWFVTSRKNSTTETNNPGYIDQDNAWRAAQDGRVVNGVRIRYLAAPYDLRAGQSPGVADTRDGLHDTVQGGVFNRGYKYANLTKGLMPAGRTLAAIGTVPAGNLNPNPLFTGTGGTKGGVGAADITGSVPDGYTLTNNNTAGSVQIASDLSVAGRWRLTISGTQVGTSQINITRTIAGAVRGKKHQVQIPLRISKADGVSAVPGIYNIAMSATSTIAQGTAGTDGHGPQIAGYGDIPTPYRPGAFPMNPETGVAADIGEMWLLSRPPNYQSPNGNLSPRFDFIPAVAGATIDCMIDLMGWFAVPFSEPDRQHAYMGASVTRSGDNASMRWYVPIGIYGASSSFGNQVAPNTTVTAANAKGLLRLNQGDWSANPDSFNGTFEYAADGVNYTTLVPDLVAAAWQYDASAITSFVGGTSKFRQTITAKKAGYADVTASEIINII